MVTNDVQIFDGVGANSALHHIGVEVVPGQLEAAAKILLALNFREDPIGAKSGDWGRVRKFYRPFTIPIQLIEPSHPKPIDSLATENHFAVVVNDAEQVAVEILAWCVDKDYPAPEISDLGGVNWWVILEDIFTIPLELVSHQIENHTGGDQEITTGDNDDTMELSGNG